MLFNPEVTLSTQLLYQELFLPLTYLISVLSLSHVPITLKLLFLKSPSIIQDAVRCSLKPLGTFISEAGEQALF